MKQIEYIESTGTQYIDTGFKHNQNTRIVADIDFQPNARYCSPFGSWGSESTSKTNLFGSEITNTTLTTLGCYYANVQSWSISSGFTGRKIWDFNKNVWSIGTNTHTFTAKTFTSLYNDLIFGKTQYGGTPNNFCTMKLYSFKIYDNGTLVRDYIPILDNDNVACLFDRVSGQNYYNQGRGDFLCADMEMITDRTQADVDSVDIDSTAVQKGAYNYTDLQRVEYKVKVLNNLLKNEDYMSETLTTKIDWKITDKFNADDGTRYLNNVKKIRQALAVNPSTPAVPSTMNKLNYVRANDIEKILVDIENLIYSMYNYYVYSGVSRSGQRRLYQNRFRHFYKYNEYNFDILSTESGESLITEDGELLEVQL